jgi:hypothetical protein
MSTIIRALRRFDAFCARLNDGLAAVALVLALVTALFSPSYLERNAKSLLPSYDAQTGRSIFDE